MNDCLFLYMKMTWHSAIRAHDQNLNPSYAYASMHKIFTLMVTHPISDFAFKRIYLVSSWQRSLVSSLIKFTFPFLWIISWRIIQVFSKKIKKEKIYDTKKGTQRTSTHSRNSISFWQSSLNRLTHNMVATRSIILADIFLWQPCCLGSKMKCAVWGFNYA